MLAGVVWDMSQGMQVFFCPKGGCWAFPRSHARDLREALGGSFNLMRDISTPAETWAGGGC